MNILGAAYGKPLGDNLEPGRMAPADTIPVSPELADALSEAAQIITLGNGAEAEATLAQLGAALDAVDNPPHYVNQPSGIEPIEITKHLNFCLGNVVKYVLRADFKGSAVQDLRKARRYLDIEIEMREQAA